jgi:hypothetical protein
VELPPLPPNAGAEEHHARSEWWHRQARTSWDLALDARNDLERWHTLMRFHRAARQAQLDERRAAFAVEAPSSSGEQVAPGVVGIRIERERRPVPASLRAGVVARI